MKQFEKILNQHKDSIHGGGWDSVELDSFGDIRLNELVGPNNILKSKQISINDLLSPSSGFMQAVFGEDWSEMYNKDYYEDDVNAFEYLYDNNNGIMSLPRWKYHTMCLAILPHEEKIKYLEDNIIIN